MVRLRLYPFFAWEDWGILVHAVPVFERDNERRLAR